MWDLFLVCGTFCVEQAQKVIGASELTPSIEGVCIKNIKDEKSSHIVAKDETMCSLFDEGRRREGRGRRKFFHLPFDW
jgi:hypothetical protein